MQALSFAQLKEMLEPKSFRESLACDLVPEGVPKGAITEISGSGKTELVATLLAEHGDARVAWVEESFSVYPAGFLQRRVDLQRILFVESGAETCWCVLQILKSQVFPIVVVYADGLSLIELRKIQLAAERAQAVVLWLTAEPKISSGESKTPWPVTLKLRVHRAEHDQLHAAVTRRKYL